MERTTQIASKITVVVFGLDGKKAAQYDVYRDTNHLADIANTLDHCRNTGLEPAEDAKHAVRSGHA